MSYENATASDHVDLFERVIAFLTEGTTGGGPGWELLRELDSGATTALLVAPGLSEAETIYVGISWHADEDLDAFALGFWMFRAFNEALPDLEQPGMSGVEYLPVWDTSMPYWLVANGQRLIITVKVTTVYVSGYVGKFLPYGTPSEYPEPLYLGMCVDAATTRFSTTAEDARSFFDPGEAARILTPSGQWEVVQNYGETSGSEVNVNESIFTWPFQSSDLDSDTKNRYRELRENLDGTYPLWPLILHGSYPQNEIYGELDGCYAVNAFSLGSEDTVTISGDVHLVVQNMHRTTRYYYCAILLE